MSKTTNLAFFASILLSVSPVLGTTIIIQPEATDVFAGNSFLVDIAISGAVDLYAFQFDLGFDPQVIAAVGISEGSLLPEGGSTFFSPGTIDNTAGTITFTADTLLGPISGVSGNGLLAIATFQALAPVSSGINLQNYFFLDSTGGGIPVTIQQGSISVSATPEAPPAAVSLAGLSFFLAAALFMRRGSHATYDRRT